MKWRSEHGEWTDEEEKRGMAAEEFYARVPT
jgi:hypothetical protein